MPQKKAYNIDDLVSAIGKCENADPRKNRYGLMCWNGRPRHLCVYSEEDARQEVKDRLARYENATPGLTLYGAIKRYSPPFENDTPKHAKCISDNSNISLDTNLINLL